ncbi:MAG: exodeoxyribonuclease VII small subunit [Thermodesulfobacteriota bacterium]
MKSFEKSLIEIKKIVEKLEEGDLSLDQSIEKFEQGTKLIKECYSMLEEVKKKVEIIVVNSENEINFEEFDNDEV